MTAAASDEAGSETSPQPPAADEDWFKQIPFNPRKGLNSMLPLEAPQPLPASEVADRDAEAR
jgi:hypothetical protein